MSGRGWIPRTLIVLGIVALVAVAAVAISAVADWPAKTATSEIVVTASREQLWDVITDLDAYQEWNPVVTRAQGVVAEGESVDVRRKEADGSVDDAELDVVIVRPLRKVRWLERLLVPGLRDREYEIIVSPAGEGRWRVLQRERVEGVAAPFTSIDSVDDELERIARALKKRVEAVSS